MWSSDILQGKIQNQRLAYILIESNDSGVDEEFLMKKIEGLSPDDLEKLVHVLAYGRSDYAADDAGDKLLKMKRKGFDRWLATADRHADEAFIAALNTGNSHLDLIDSLFWYEKVNKAELTQHQERCLIWATAAALIVHSTWRLDEMEFQKIVLGQNKDGSINKNEYVQIITSNELLAFVFGFERDPRDLYDAIKKADTLEVSEVASCLQVTL